MQIMPGDHKSPLLGLVREALDGGRSLEELEGGLLADGAATDDEAAAWLYAWAYDAARPSDGTLAARITDPRPAGGIAHGPPGGSM